MPDDANASSSDFGSLDLNSLSDLSLGPDWGSGKAPVGKTPKVREGDDRRERRGGGAPRDRRGPRPERREFRPSGDGENRERRAPRSGDDRERRGPREGGPRDRRGPRVDRGPPFEPVVDVTFYPEDKAFEALAEAVRSSARTFELFEVARLILAKPERFVCLVKHPEQVEGQPARLHACVIDGLPFATEEEAVAHTMKHYLDQFLEVEEIEVEPPKGNFQMIHQCGVTKALLGPPNYHRYQKLLEEHHAANLPRMAFHRFQQQLQTVRDEEVISQWLDQMRKQKRYKVKEDLEGVEPAAFDNLESARFHLLMHGKEKLVRPAYSAKFPGRALEKLAPGDPVRRSVEFLHERQVRFPLDTANSLRSRLRRMNFSIYKRGAKGVSYVCAVKRRTRVIGESMADNLSDLLAFLEAHPNLPQNDLPHQYLGLDLAAEGAAEALSPEDKEKLSTLRRDLRYLVTQGYVIEFSDGRLFAPPAAEKRVEGAKASAKKAAAPRKAEKADAPQKSAGPSDPAPDPTRTAEPVSTTEPTPAVAAVVAPETTPDSEPSSAPTADPPPAAPPEEEVAPAAETVLPLPVVPVATSPEPLAPTQPETPAPVPSVEVQAIEEAPSAPVPASTRGNIPPPPAALAPEVTPSEETEPTPATPSTPPTS